MRISNPFMRLFGQSPFKPLQRHMREVVKCANQVPKLFEALFNGDQGQVEEVRDEIFHLENAADAIKNELRAHLPKSVFLPVARGDLLEILDFQDSIADTAQDIAGLLVVRPMEPPAAMRDALFTFVWRCVDACNQMAKIMESLDELVETGFRGREAQQVLTMIDELNDIETDTDQLAMQLLLDLFAHEKKSDPVSVLLWLELIQRIGDLADFAERVGNRLRLLLAH